MHWKCPAMFLFCSFKFNNDGLWLNTAEILRRIVYNQSNCDSFKEFPSSIEGWKNKFVNDFNNYIGIK